MRLALPLLLLLALPAGARDVGQFGAVDQATHEWFTGLTNQRGDICCDTADGHRLDDPDWRINPDGTYSVAVLGGWQKVPPDLVVRTPNRIGVAVVWIWPPDQFASAANPQKVRCFMAGATG